MQINLEMSEPVAWLMGKQKRIKILVGGRGSGKSVGVTDAMIIFADQGQRICGTREFQNSIDDSVHENVKQEIERLGVEGFEVRAMDIKTHSGGEFFYRGLARNITSLKSIAGVNKLWIEEGESVSEKSLKVLTPSIRSTASGGEPPEIWITMNRHSREDAIAKKYLARAESELERSGRYEDEMVMIAQMNWSDNPWFPPELEQERLDDKARLSADEYEHIWEGRYIESVENAIIKKEWFDAAIDAHKKLGIEPTGAVIATHDPADMGGDAKGYACRHGVYYHDIREIESETGNDACRVATDLAISQGADLFIWDGDGMGALLREQIARSFSGKKCELRMYKGSGAVEDKKAVYDGLYSLSSRDKPKTNADMFYNKRAQYYMKLAQRFYNTYRAINGEYIDPDDIISINSEIKQIDKLRSEVCRIPRKNNRTGKIQLMSKQDMLAIDIPSPNMADCLAMGEEIPKPQKPVKIQFKGWS